VKILRGDLKSPKEAEKAVRDVDVVFHYAANPEVRVSTTNPDIHFNENVVATFNLLEAMRKNDVKQLVFASSSSVYGEPENIPVSEDAPIKPVSVYGASKAACESLIHAYSNLYGIRSIILRYANIIGPHLRHGIIYDLMLKLRKNSKVLEILGNGTQIRSYLYITDAVEATLIAYEHLQRDFEVYNIGNEDSLTVKGVTDIVVEVLGLNDVKYIYKPMTGGIGWLGDVKRILLDISKMKKLGWKPNKDCREAVRSTVESLAMELANYPSKHGLRARKLQTYLLKVKATKGKLFKNLLKAS